MKTKLEQLRTQLSAATAIVDQLLIPHQKKQKLKPGPPPCDHWNARFGIRNDVASIWSNLPEKLTYHDLKAAIQSKYKKPVLSDSSYSAELSKLVNEGYLEILIPGSGRRPSICRRLIEEQKS